MRRIGHHSHISGIVSTAALALLFAAPIGVGAQNLYVTQQNLANGNGSVEEYSPTGVDLGTIYSTADQYLSGLAFTPGGDLLVANHHNSTIQRLSPTGAFLGTFASTGQNDVQALAVNGAGDVFASNYGDGTVHEFSPTGADLGVFANVSAVGNPTGLALDSRGNLYVDITNSGPFMNDQTIQEYSPTGSLLANYGYPVGTESNGIAVNSSGDVFSSYRNSFDLGVILGVGSIYGAGTIYEYGPAPLYTPQAGFGAALSAPYGLAFNGSGDLFSADSGDDTIHEFSPTNADLGTFAFTGPDEQPIYLAFSNPAATPEPGSLALAAGALVQGAALLYRRRRKPGAKQRRG